MIVKRRGHGNQMFFDARTSRWGDSALRGDGAFMYGPVNHFNVGSQRRGAWSDMMAVYSRGVHSLLQSGTDVDWWVAPETVTASLKDVWEDFAVFSYGTVNWTTTPSQFSAPINPEMSILGNDAPFQVGFLCYVKSYGTYTPYTVYRNLWTYGNTNTSNYGFQFRVRWTAYSSADIDLIFGDGISKTSIWVGPDVIGPSKYVWVYADYNPNRDPKLINIVHGLSTAAEQPTVTTSNPSATWAVCPRGANSTFLFGDYNASSPAIDVRLSHCYLRVGNSAHPYEITDVKSQWWARRTHVYRYAIEKWKFFERGRASVISHLPVERLVGSSVFGQPTVHIMT